MPAALSGVSEEEPREDKSGTEPPVDWRGGEYAVKRVLQVSVLE